MSHLISTYAGATGLKVGSPAGPVSQFAPVPYDRYITVQTGSGQGAKNYDYWQEVVALIGPILSRHNIAILHLGAKDDPMIQGVHDMRGKTTPQQATYLIERALAHMGNDSWLAHCAGWKGRPLVALYGSTSAHNHGPYWYDKRKTILLSSHRAGGIPTYSAQESPKTINWIPPEDVVNAVLSLLELPDTQQLRHETRLIGLIYANVLFDVVPNSFPSPTFMPDAPFTVRMDYLHNEQVLANLLASGRKVNIVTKKPIDINLIGQFRQSILSYTHEIDSDCPVQYTGRLPGLVKHTSFFTKEKDDARVADLRFRFFDVASIMRVSDVTRDDYLNAALVYRNLKEDQRPRLEAEIGAGILHFKTNKYLLSDGKIYLSPAHLRLSQPTDSFASNRGVVIDSGDFWVDTNHTIILSNALGT